SCFGESAPVRLPIPPLRRMSEYIGGALRAGRRFRRGGHGEIRIRRIHRSVIVTNRAVHCTSRTVQGQAARGVGPLQGAGRSGSASGRGGAGGSLLFLDPVPQLVAPGGETLARLEEARQGTARCDVA